LASFTQSAQLSANSVNTIAAAFASRDFRRGQNDLLVRKQLRIPKHGNCKADGSQGGKTRGKSSSQEGRSAEGRRTTICPSDTIGKSNMTIDRKVEMPKVKSASDKSACGTSPQADFHVPEVDTDFADNLFQDHSFADRFDASFSPTVPMGIASESPETSKTSSHDWNITFDFPGKPKA
jgi:hypothetical protein